MSEVFDAIVSREKQVFMPMVRRWPVARERGFGQVDEAPEQPHHRGLPCRAADAVDLGERRLAQEGLVDQLGTQQRELLARRQRVLADDARHALQLRLLIQQREEAPAQRQPLAVALRRPPRRELARIFEDIKKKSEVAGAGAASPFAEITDDDIDNLFSE